MWILFRGENLRSLRFKSSYEFYKLHKHKETVKNVMLPEDTLCFEIFWQIVDSYNEPYANFNWLVHYPGIYNW